MPPERGDSEAEGEMGDRDDENAGPIDEVQQAEMAAEIEAANADQVVAAAAAEPQRTLRIASRNAP